MTVGKAKEQRRFPCIVSKYVNWFVRSETVIAMVAIVVMTHHDRCKLRMKGFI